MVFFEEGGSVKKPKPLLQFLDKRHNAPDLARFVSDQDAPLALVHEALESVDMDILSDDTRGEKFFVMVLEAQGILEEQVEVHQTMLGSLQSIDMERAANGGLCAAFSGEVPVFAEMLRILKRTQVAQRALQRAVTDRYENAWLHLDEEVWDPDEEARKSKAEPVPSTTAGNSSSKDAPKLKGKKARQQAAAVAAAAAPVEPTYAAPAPVQPPVATTAKNGFMQSSPDTVVPARKPATPATPAPRTAPTPTAPAPVISKPAGVWADNSIPTVPVVRQDSNWRKKTSLNDRS